MEATVSEVHGYPLRPEGFAEPLFLTQGHKKEIAEHLAASSWLCRASEARSITKEQEPVEVIGDSRRMELRRTYRRNSGGWMRRRIAEVVERWREVDEWWSEGEYTDCLVFRVSLDSGAVVDLSLDRASRQWSLVGVVD